MQRCRRRASDYEVKTTHLQSKNSRVGTREIGNGLIRQLLCDGFPLTLSDMAMT